MVPSFWQATTPAGVATSWVVSQGAVPLVGARTPNQVDQIVHALAVPLAQEHLTELDQASGHQRSALDQLLVEVRESVDPCEVRTASTGTVLETRAGSAARIADGSA